MRAEKNCELNLGISSIGWLPVRDLVEREGPEKSSGIVFFHTFTGSDVVSAFHGKGKKNALQTWAVSRVFQ